MSAADLIFYRSPTSEAILKEENEHATSYSFLSKAMKVDESKIRMRAKVILYSLTLCATCLSKRSI